MSTDNKQSDVNAEGRINKVGEIGVEVKMMNEFVWQESF